MRDIALIESCKRLKSRADIYASHHFVNQGPQGKVTLSVLCKEIDEANG